MAGRSSPSSSLEGTASIGEACERNGTGISIDDFDGRE
jgi:hypothetical protein